ncbi:translation initiation factor [Xanthomonas phage XaC1]|nr:translation initiation factor [Xanthomonas phage XaC1]
MNQIIANESITATQVRLVHEGVSTVMATASALEFAQSKDLDLVQITDREEVPVVKVLDYNKYVYEMKQTQKANDKKQRTTAVQVKEIQLSSVTQENDLNVKVKKAQEFITGGKQVRLVMKVIGRVSSNKELIQQGISKMNVFVGFLNNVDFVQTISVQGNNIVCTIKSAK